MGYSVIDAASGKVRLSIDRAKSYRFKRRFDAASQLLIVVEIQYEFYRQYLSSLRPELSGDAENRERERSLTRLFAFRSCRSLNLLWCGSSLPRYSV